MENGLGRGLARSPTRRPARSSPRLRASAGQGSRGSNTPVERRADRLGAGLGSPRPHSPSGSAPSGRPTAQRRRGPSPRPAGREGLLGEMPMSEMGADTGRIRREFGSTVMANADLGVADLASLLGRGRSSDGRRKECLKRAVKRTPRSQLYVGYGADSVFPEATPVGALPAQLRRPRTRSATSAKRRLQPSRVRRSGRPLTVVQIELEQLSAPSGSDRAAGHAPRLSDHPAKPCEARRWMSAGGFAVLGSANTRSSSGTTRSTRTCCRG